jgi:hypothetical protein
VFLYAQRSPVRSLEARRHNHTPRTLKCERGEKRRVYERDREFHGTIFIRKKDLERMRGLSAPERGFVSR